MKVLWLFPPMGKGFPNVSQYRFYKKMPIRASIIYPYLAASGVTQIRDAGHDVSLIDCATEEKTWKDVARTVSDSDLVILEGRTPIIKEIWKDISHVKCLNSDVKVAVYGDHVSWDPFGTFDKGADFIIKGGDFDYSAAKLCNDLESGNHPGKIINYLVPNLDSLPFVDRELVNWRNYFESWRKRDVFLWNMSQRGCYYHCVYCAWAETLWGNKIRYRSPSNVLLETADLWERYGDLEILDDADLFDFTWGLKWAKLLIKEGFYDKEILWSCQTHPAQIRNLEDLKIMKKSGLSVVKLGIESSHDISLWNMKKGLTREQCEKAIKLLKEAGVMVHVNMIIGFPWENRKMVLDSVEWLKKLDPNQAQFSMLIPYPNTEIWQLADEADWFIQDKLNWELYDAQFPMMKMDGLSGEEIIDLYQECWRSFYLNWKYILKHLISVRHWSGLKQLYHGFKSVYYGHMRAVDKKRKQR